jgi:Anti-sigma-K factor rskA/Putative zinc-finger
VSMTCDAVRDLAPVFVLGALEPAEEKAVRDHLATCDRPHPEFEAFGGVVQYLDETVELIEPPASLKERVLAAVAAEPRARRSDRAATRPVPAVEVVAPRPERRAAERRAAERRAQERRRRDPMAMPIGIAAAAESGDLSAGDDRRRTMLIRTAALVSIAALAGWNITLQAQAGSANPYARAVADVVDLAARPGSQTAILSADAGRAPRGIAAVGSDGSVALAIRELDPTVNSQVYQVWLIAPGGTTSPVGSFQVGSNGTGSLTARATAVSGATIAITREPGRGATAPTLPILARGVAFAPPS